jgi:cell pole-organizing protein PopZ
MDQLGAEDSILDEESLRELVADIVRAELQGALGERITRNVRKLVRREIQRALSAQDLL